MQKCVEAKDRLIERQCIGIQELEHQVVVLRAERDALLRDIDRLCLQLEVIDLQRLSNGR